MEWRAIERYEGTYWVSDEGRVGKRRVSGDVVALFERTNSQRPYLTVRITWKGKNETLSIHREVAMAFLPNPDGHPFVRHLNDVKTDNRLENLAWGGPRENANDSVRNKTNRAAKQTHCAKGLHERTPENLVERTKPDGRTTLTCKPCELERVRRSYANNAEKRREYARNRLANMTPEQRKALNAYHSEWNRARKGKSD